MKKLFFVLLIIVWFHPLADADTTLNGWIKGDICWVVKTPDTKSPIVGIISKKAAVTVNETGEPWLKIIFAPIRDPKTGKWIECSGCYIKKDNFTTTIPTRW